MFARMSYLTVSPCRATHVLSADSVGSEQIQWRLTISSVPMVCRYCDCSAFTVLLASLRNTGQVEMVQHAPISSSLIMIMAYVPINFTSTWQSSMCHCINHHIDTQLDSVSRKVRRVFRMIGPLPCISQILSLIHI